jgi:hypothetical protein
VRVCCACGEEDRYKMLLTLPVAVVYEGRRFTRTPFDQSEVFICLTCLEEEAKNIFACS